MQSLFFTLVAAFLICLFIRTGYELLKEARKIDAENKLVFAFIFSTMCVLWICWFCLCPLDPSAFEVPDSLRWIGLTLFIAGSILTLGALTQLRGVENIKRLVTTGLFAKIRHPMYLGFSVWIIGWSLYHHAFVSMIVGLVGIINVLYWRRLEESRLLVQHGEAYREYQKTTWF